MSIATPPFLGPWRVLVVNGCTSATQDALIPSTDLAQELQGLPHVQVHTLRAPTLADVHAALTSFQPNVLYLWSGCSGSPDAGTSRLQAFSLSRPDGAGVEVLPSSALLALAALAPLQALLLNVHPEGLPLSDLRPLVPHVMHWSPGHSVSAINAAQFAISTLSPLRHTSITFPEAFALGVHILRAHGTGDAPARQAPLFPVLQSSDLPDLPGTKPMPPPVIEGMDLSAGLSRSVPGWDTTRLLSPVAEVTLGLTALPSVLDTERLAALGLALRALLTLEVRSVRVLSMHALAHTPSHIVPGSDVARCVLVTRAGVRFPVVIGAPSQVMKSSHLLQAALQTTLTCDAISLRFQLPPYGSAAPDAARSPAIAHGTPTTPVLLVTSLWVVTLLRTLAADRGDRLVPLLGVGAVSSQACQGLTLDDAARFQVLQTQQPPLVSIPQLSYTRLNVIGGPPPAVLDANIEAAAAIAKAEQARAAAKVDRNVALRETRFEKITRNAEGVEQWASSRPPLHQCTPAQFTDDLQRFLAERQHWHVEPQRFPDAVLNGSNLDLWNLYREVVTRGGFKVGNGINWKGQVFTKMNNWTATHKMTGVGNALKRHYHNFLWEYERANQRDVAGDRCVICHQGVEGGSDWVACGNCQRWQHFACDSRSQMGSFADFKNDAGRVFECIDCERARHTAPPLAAA